MERCLRCDLELRPIRMLDRTRGEWGDLVYTSLDAQGTFFSPRLPIEGTVHGAMCPRCRRIELFGFPFEPENEPQPIAEPVQRTVPPDRGPDVEPPQRNVDFRLPQSMIEDEPATAEIATPPGEWRVTVDGRLDRFFVEEPEAELEARRIVALDPQARVMVHGPRGRRYRVLP